MKKKLIKFLSAMAVLTVVSFGVAGCSSTSQSVSAKITLGDEVTVDGDGVKVDGQKVTINKPGTFDISGTLTDGQIIVDNNTKENVYLNLNGVNITSSDNAAINVLNSKNTIISLGDSTENIITDSDNYSGSSDEDVDAAIFSKDDLTIKGTGTLTVNGNYKKGIHSKDDLKITDGVINVKAKGDGIQGKDSVTVKGGTITIDSGEDGIKSTNDSDDDKGNVVIEGGKINITSGEDGIQAEKNISVVDGDLTITAGGGYENAEAKANVDAMFDIGKMKRNDSSESDTSNEKDKMVQHSTNSDSEYMMRNNGRPEMPKGDERPIGQVPNGQAQPEGQMTPPGINNSQKNNDINKENSNSTENTASTKGIKAGKDINIDGGNINVNSKDDAIHSDDTVTINNGTINVSTGDDGIHSETNLTINNGNITVEESYEGIESKVIDIKDGNIKVKSSDDGINASGNSENKNSFDQNANTDKDAVINIEGGNLYVDASGDGIDSNGSIKMNAGTVIVNGSVNGGNGALDYDIDFEITGGVLIAAGSSGMAQASSQSSKQNSVMITLQTQNADTLVNISDGNGNSIVTFSPTKNFSNIVVSSADLKNGSTYNVSIGGKCDGQSNDGLYSDGTYSGGTSVGSFKVDSSLSSVVQDGVQTSTRNGIMQRGNM